MNVLVYVPQMASFGGMERHVCGLTSALAARGHRVVLLTTSKSLGHDLRSELTTHGVTFRELARDRGRAGPLLKGAWILCQTLRARRTAWDVVYTNGQSGLARVAWLAAGPRTRILHHHHTAGDAGEKKTWSPLFRRVLTEAPEVIACSRATQNALADSLGRKDVRFLPYLTPCPIAADQVVDRAYPEGAKLNFGYTGRLVAEKGIDSICALSQRPELADITWHIYGEGPAYPPAFFQRYPRIVHHGRYTGPERQAEALQSLDALVLFSTHNEGMPLSLIEGMCAGLPWIATNRGGTREIALSPANSIVVDRADDIDLLAAAAQEMVRRLRSGIASRREQRRVYDQVFSPAAVSAAWCNYIENGHALS